MVQTIVNLTDELRKLAELHQEGHLNDQEFADAKRRLIAESRDEPLTPSINTIFRVCLPVVRV